MSEPAFDNQETSHALTGALRRTGDAVVLAVTGDVDLTTIAQFRAAVADGVRQAGEGMLVIDLTAVDLFGPYAVLALAESKHHGREPLRVVVDLARPAIWPIELVGLEQVLTLGFSVRDALAPQAGFGSGAHRRPDS